MKNPPAPADLKPYKVSYTFATRTGSLARAVLVIEADSEASAAAIAKGKLSGAVKFPQIVSVAPYAVQEDLWTKTAGA